MSYWIGTTSNLTELTEFLNLLAEPTLKIVHGLKDQGDIDSFCQQLSLDKEKSCVFHSKLMNILDSESTCLMPLHLYLTFALPEGYFGFSPPTQTTATLELIFCAQKVIAMSDVITHRLGLELLFKTSVSTLR